MSNRTEGTTRKRSHMPTGRLKPLRLFSTLLAIALRIPPAGVLSVTALISIVTFFWVHLQEPPVLPTAAAR
jgi:hypothetical protein